MIVQEATHIKNPCESGFFIDIHDGVSYIVPLLKSNAFMRGLNHARFVCEKTAASYHAGA